MSFSYKLRMKELGKNAIRKQSAKAKLRDLVVSTQR